MAGGPRGIRLGGDGGARPRPLARARRVPAQPRGAEGRAALRLLRGPADRERTPRRPPRAGARLQGHLPALPDHARPLRRSPRGVGLPRPAGGDRGREAPGHLGQAADRGLRDRGVQRALPRVGGRLRRRVGAPDRADRLLDRQRAGLPHDGRGLHRERLVEPRRAVPARPPLPERQGRALLPALRHRSVEPRGRPRLRGGRGPLGLRPLPAPRRARHVAAGLDHHPVDSSGQPGGGGQPGRRLRRGGGRGGDADPGRGPGRARPRRGRSRRPPGARAGAGGAQLRPPVPVRRTGRTRSWPPTS